MLLVVPLETPSQSSTDNQIATPPKPPPNFGSGGRFSRFCLPAHVRFAREAMGAALR